MEGVRTGQPWRQAQAPNHQKPRPIFPLAAGAVIAASNVVLEMAQLPEQAIVARNISVSMILCALYNHYAPSRARLSNTFCIEVLCLVAWFNFK
jgi:hypothetical protein